MVSCGPTYPRLGGPIGSLVATTRRARRTTPKAAGLAAMAGQLAFGRYRVHGYVDYIWKF